MNLSGEVIRRMAQEPLSPLMEVITDFFVWLMLTIWIYGVEISWWSDFRSKMCMNLCGLNGTQMDDNRFDFWGSGQPGKKKGPFLRKSHWDRSLVHHFRPFHLCTFGTY